jgi:hypothetical protein
MQEAHDESSNDRFLLHGGGITFRDRLLEVETAGHATRRNRQAGSQVRR